MRPRSLSSMTLALLLFTACGGEEDDDLTPDPAEEAPVLSQAAGLSSSAAHAKAVTELFVEEDPTIDPSKDEAANAASVKARAMTAVSCPGASVSLDQASNTVTVDFGTACLLPNLGTVSGQVSATVSKPAAMTVRVSFYFTNLSVNGRALTGTLVVTTSNGTTYSATANLSSGGKTLVLDSATFTLDSGGKGVTISGTGTVDSGAGAQAVTFNSVHHLFDGCYADSGTIVLSKTVTGRSGKTATVSETITFSSTTPSTGQVQIQIGTTSPATTTLPAYGTCPHA